MSGFRYRVYSGEPLEVAVVSAPGLSSVESAAAKLGDIAAKIGSLSCTAELQGEGGIILQFVNYPRGKYRHRAAGDVARLGARVASDIGGRAIPPHLTKDTIVLGRRRGYEGDSIPAESITRTIAARAKSGFEVKNIHALSVSPKDIYMEPAMEIQYNHRSDLAVLSQVAYEYEQERFSLVIPGLEKVYTIETGHCKEPDVLLASVSLEKSRLVQFVYMQED